MSNFISRLAVVVAVPLIVFAGSLNAHQLTNVPAERTKEINHDNLRLTPDAAVSKYGTEARQRLKAAFAKAHLKYPPREAKLVCLKRNRIVYLLAKNSADKWQLISSYPIVSASGKEGPKLKLGDMQVPEGFYKINELNAWTHLALCVNYPNDFDKIHAREDRRRNLGSNIEIHNGTLSTGCVVVDNLAAEDLFTLVYDTPAKRMSFIIAPCNLAKEKPNVDFKTQPGWLPKLYKDLGTALSNMPI